MAEQIEQKYYTSLFTKTDISGTGKIEGKQAVALFRTSGISVQILKQIWTLATPNQEDHLDKNRFFVALKLIALAQDGKPLSIQLLHEKSSLPKFEGIELPRVPDEWEIGENEFSVYLNGFKKLSGDKGFLTASESKELLQRTQFSPPVLKKIWGLLGLDSTVNMSQEQFMVAMQLVAKARAGVEIPDVLPSALDKLLSKNAPQPPKIELSPPKPVEETKKNDPPKYKDPEPAHQLPKSVSRITLPESAYDESPKVLTSRSNNLDLEKNIKEKEKVLKEKTNFLKSLGEILEFDLAEIDLIKEKNKILEEKIKENDESFGKVLAKINKVKDKFVKELTESQKNLESLRKENALLQEKLSSKSQPPSRASEDLKVDVKQSAPKNMNFEFDDFFKGSNPSISDTSSKKESVSKSEARPSFGFSQDSKDSSFQSKDTSKEVQPEIKSSPNMFSPEMSFSAIPKQISNPEIKSQDPKPTVESKPPSTSEIKQPFNADFKPQFNSDFKPQFNTDFKPQFNTEAKPQFNTDFKPQFNTEAKPQFNADFKPQFNTEAKPQFNADFKPQFNTEVKPQFNTDIKPQFNTEFKPQFNPDDMFSQNFAKPNSLQSIPKQSTAEKPKFQGFEGFGDLKSQNAAKSNLRDDDVFSGLDKNTAEKGRPSKIESESSSGSENPKDAGQNKLEFGFKFGEPEKKTEKPVTFEFKPENIAFPAQFEGFNKGFNFPNAAPAFDSDFFKIDTQTIKPKGVSRELEFD